MWQALTIAHRKPGISLPQGSNGEGHDCHRGAVTWKTCLREIDFGAREGSEEAYIGFDAHRFLVEVCSGLHSPLFGETEVFGQFRAFRAAHQWDAAWSEFFDAVEEDVRKLRRTHLVDIGSQSYGSLARRHLPEGEAVTLVGSGRLALDLLPWIGDRSVTTAMRNPSKATSEHRRVCALTPEALAGNEASHWLIAAPVSNEELLLLWQANPARTVLDFRAEAAFTAPPKGCEKYFTLRSLYAELESVRELHTRKRLEALEFAATLSHRRSHAVVHRPYGWEDAFA
jgi:glutamyl-tRNA reductase